MNGNVLQKLNFLHVIHNKLLVKTSQQLVVKIWKMKKEITKNYILDIRGVSLIVALDLLIVKRMRMKVWSVF